MLLDSFQKIVCYYCEAEAGTVTTDQTGFPLRVCRITLQYPLSLRSFLVDGPVAVFRQCGPGFIATGLSDIIVTVGRFLNGKIIPFGGLIVRPGNHTGQQILGGFGNSLQYAVDHGHGFRSGNVALRMEVPSGLPRIHPWAAACSISSFAQWCSISENVT